MATEPHRLLKQNWLNQRKRYVSMVMGDDDMNYINPAERGSGPGAPNPLGPASRRDYEKHPERVFRLKQDVLVPAGTLFTRAPVRAPASYGGVDYVDAVVGLGAHAQAYLSLPLRVAEIDAAEWFAEELSDKSVHEVEAIGPEDGTLVP